MKILYYVFLPLILVFIPSILCMEKKSLIPKDAKRAELVKTLAESCVYFDAETRVTEQDTENFVTTIARLRFSDKNCIDTEIINNSLIQANTTLIDFQDEDEWTALHWVAHEGKSEIAKILLDSVHALLQEILIFKQNCSGQTGLHLAARNNCKNVAELLLGRISKDKARQLVFIPDKSGDTALHNAVCNNDKEMVILILDAAGTEATQLIHLKGSSGSAWDMASGEIQNSMRLYFKKNQ